MDLRELHDAMDTMADLDSARGVVIEIARLVGIDLSEDVLDGDVFSEANMRRVVTRVSSLRAEVARSKGLPEHGFAPSLGEGIDVGDSMRVRGW